MTRVVRTRPGIRVDAGDAFQSLFGDATHAFWLDIPGGSVLGAVDPGAALIEGDETTDAYGLLRAALAERHADGDGGPAPGWFGWLGYEFGARAAGAPTRESSVPQVALMRCSRLVVVTDAGVELVTLADDPGAESWVEAVVARLHTTAVRSRRRAQDLPAGRPGAAPSPAGRRGAAWRPQPARWRTPEPQYLAAAEACIAAIGRGDAYQLCLTDTARVDAHPDPVELRLALRAASPTASGGLIRFGDVSLVSASPEEFLSVRGGRVRTRPIKGTRPRGADAADDARLRDELANDPKERAENLMIVDLMRNDLGRVAELGTVEVTGLLEVESYAPVHQLVSTVEARLAPGLTAVDAVAAAFPAGSMTGAPKLAAMRILHDLETGPRGVYAGCFGWFGFDGSVRLSMCIRSLVVDPHGVTVGAGGGITALSDPARELAETRLKAALPLALLGAR